MALYKKILIATDGSDYTKKAVHHGLELAKAFGAEVTAINVMDMGSVTSSSQGYGLPDINAYMQKSSDEAINYVMEKGKEMGVEVKAISKMGSPANDIVEASKNYDLIVMGTIGRTGISKLLLGSVAEKVVRFAECPVLVIRNHPDKQ